LFGLTFLCEVAGNIGGSLMSLGSKEKKNIKKIAKSVSHKVDKIGDKARKSVSTRKLGSVVLESLPEIVHWNSNDKTRIQREQERDNQDPGVNSDEEDGQLEVRSSLFVWRLFIIIRFNCCRTFPFKVLPAP